MKGMTRKTPRPQSDEAKKQKVLSRWEGEGGAVPGVPPPAPSSDGPARARAQKEGTPAKPVTKKPSGKNAPRK
jgi:hypothetical protein